MKLLLLAVMAIFLASAFAVQARAESMISFVAVNRQQNVVAGYVTPPPHGPATNQNVTSDFEIEMVEETRESADWR